jgi:hypothetical protein
LGNPNQEMNESLPFWKSWLVIQQTGGSDETHYLYRHHSV